MHHQPIKSRKPPTHNVAPLSESPHMACPKTVYILYSVTDGKYTVKFVSKDFSKASIEMDKQKTMAVIGETWGIAEAPLLI